VQPPSYGIRLEGAAVVRETEDSRLQPLAAGEAAPDTPSAAKPTPGADVTTADKVSLPWLP
jgi:hypothetical protein